MDWQTARDSFDHQQVASLVRDLWDGDPQSVKLVGQAYNIVYRFEAQGEGFYLRIGHPILHPLNKVHSVMHFLCYLAEQGVPVGQPIQSVNQNYIEVLDDGYYAAAQTEAPGAEMGLDHTDLSVYEAWGQSLGKLHQASRQYQPPTEYDYKFPTVQQFWKNVESIAMTETLPEIRAIYERLTEYIDQLPDHDYGLIHGDYRPGNVIWDGTTARTVDFDEPNFHWYIADVSRALLEFHDRPVAQRRAFREAFMRGYRTEHQIDEFWVTQLPQFGQWRGMLMHLWTLEEGGSGSWGRDWVLNQYEW